MQLRRGPWLFFVNPILYQMEQTKAATGPRKLPEGFLFAPLDDASDGRPALSLGLVLRAEKDPVAGHWIPVRQTPDARVLLGAICDQADRVIDLVEVWVQTPSLIETGKIGFAETLNNPLLESRWEGQLAANAATAPDSFLAVSELAANGAPTVVDLGSLRVVPLHAFLESEPWVLCTDDALLELAGLSPYSSTMARYLHQPAKGAESDYVPLHPACQRNEYTRELADLLPKDRPCLLFNTEAGRIGVRRLAPLGLKEFGGLLGGAPWRGLDQAKTPFLPAGLGRTLQDMTGLRDGGEHLFRSREGQAARLAEAFYLKLTLLAELFSVTREAVKAAQVPFYSLSAESFRVRLGGISPHLPYLWAFRAELCATPDAFPLPTVSEDTRFFKPLAAPAFSVYRPQAMSANIRGHGSFRLRRVRDVGKGEIVLEGTLATSEKVDGCQSDLVFMRVPLGDTVFDTFAQVSSAEGLADGEVRFTSLGQAVTPDQRDALKACEGVPLPRVLFELLPIMRSPCDVYSLAVIGLELLLVNESNTLAVAVDESLSLARQINLEAEKGGSVLERVERLFEGDARWRESLGPHRLLTENLGVERGATLFPTALWTRFLAVLLRCFPGIGPDSYHADFGAVSPFALENAFDEPLKNLVEVRALAKNLVMSDWARNREIAGLIRSGAGQTA